jgi:methylmalonyl-CoA decarboxylase
MGETEMARVKLEIRDGIGILTLDHPEKRNALSEAMVEELLGRLRELQVMKVPVVILRAADGGQVWSAGHDVKELPRSHRDPLGYFDSLERVLRAVQRYPGAVIAAVHGSVWGGACDLVMSCDLVVGDETSSFAMTPAKLGLPYNPSGVLHFMNRVGLNVAKEMFFTADPIPAERAERVGILNSLVPSAQLMDAAMDLARRIAVRSSLSVTVIKEQLRVLSGAFPLAPEQFEHLQGLRRRVYDSDDYEEGIEAFLKKRAPVFKGK